MIAKWLEPKQYRMGFVGKDRTPIYASCADCGEKEAVIAGDLRDDSGIGVIQKQGEHGMEFHLAVFCQSCFATRWED